jgi:hypothetical protein
LKHSASARFWSQYRALPKDVRELADKSFRLLHVNPAHPSLHFKKLGKVWSARVGVHYRALAVDVDGGYLWIWIGSHNEYDKLRT